MVAGGDALLSPTVTRRLIERVRRGQAADPGRARVAAALTDREREVLALVARGAVATTRSPTRLVRQPGHRQDPRQPRDDQAGRADRAQLVVIAYETGLVRPGWLG